MHCSPVGHWGHLHLMAWTVRSLHGHDWTKTREQVQHSHQLLKRGHDWTKTRERISKTWPRISIYVFFLCHDWNSVAMRSRPVVQRTDLIKTPHHLNEQALHLSLNSPFSPSLMFPSVSCPVFLFHHIPLFLLFSLLPFTLPICFSFL